METDKSILYFPCLQVRTHGKVCLVNFVIRGCRLCVGFVVTARTLRYNKLRNTSAHVWNSSSNQMPENNMSTTTVCPWCLQLFMTIWVRIQALGE